VRLQKHNKHIVRLCSQVSTTIVLDTENIRKCKHSFLWHQNNSNVRRLCMTPSFTWTIDLQYFYGVVFPALTIYSTHDALQIFQSFIAHAASSAFTTATPTSSEWWLLLVADCDPQVYCMICWRQLPCAHSNLLKQLTKFC